MVRVLEARKAARQALEASYEGSCTIIEYQDITDPKTERTWEEEIMIAEKQPCRLSFEKLAAASQTETATAVSQTVKLFLAPEINIKAGSKLIVSQNGVTEEYAASGVAASYATHQEILLSLWEEWA